MTYNQVIRAIKDYGNWEMQEMINSGQAWKMEGSYGRTAMAMLDSGACMLPKTSCRDFYGNLVPSRDILEKGTKGTFQNCVNYYENVVGDIMDWDDNEDDYSGCCGATVYEDTDICAECGEHI